MRTPSRIAIAGLGVAALGWGTALGLLAPAASAATSQASPARYDSKASATTGEVSVPDVTDSALSVTAVAEHGTSDSPQRASLRAAGTVLTEAEATASQSGTSTACATILSADCAPGQARAQMLRLSLPGLTGYSVVVTIAGPRATCTAGPAGSGRLTSADSAARATVDLQDNGRSVLPSGAAPLTDGSVFTTLQNALGNSPLNPALSALTAATPLTVTLSPGSHSVSGSTATASTGQVTITSGTVPLLDIRAATVTCGPDTPSPDSYVSSGAKSVAGTGTWDAPASSLTTEIPALQGLTG